MGNAFNKKEMRFRSKPNTNSIMIDHWSIHDCVEWHLIINESQ